MTSSPLVVGTEPLFWNTMQYRCDVGETEIVRYLEVGCEGPVAETRLEALPPPAFAPEKVEVKYTASGRRIVPVPYVAGRCPNGHPMSHVDWQHDRQLPADIPASQIPPTHNLTSSAPSVFIFRYPDDADQHLDACGIPSEWFPGYNMVRTETVIHHQVDPETGRWVERIPK